MFRFENPIYLWLLLIIPILIILKIMMWYVQRKKLSRIGNPTLLKELMPDVSRFRPWVKFLLLITALSSLILALARPQFGSKISHEKRNGIEAIIALDISNSMLAQDVQPSRLDKSKLMIENLINSFINDKIGLVVFCWRSLCAIANNKRLCVCKDVLKRYYSQSNFSTRNRHCSCN